jgi:protein gp37
MLDLPVRWKKPRIIFVESMGDIAGEGVEFEWFVRIMNLIHKVRRHIYLMLTKRPVQLNDLLKRYECMITPGFGKETVSIAREFTHLWVGVTITGHLDAWRLYSLGHMDVAHRWLSYEPMLDCPPLLFPEPLDLEGYENPQPVEWVVCGAQTGAGAKQPDPLWVKDVVAQCKAHNVPLFMKESLHLGPGMRQFPPEMERLKP